MEFLLGDTHVHIALRFLGLRGAGVQIQLTRDSHNIGVLGTRTLGVHANAVCMIGRRVVFNAPTFGARTQQGTRYIGLGLATAHYDVHDQPLEQPEKFLYNRKRLKGENSDDDDNL